MATKGNMRSMRFSNEMTQLIERQIGNNFTEKFENLVTRCMWELPHQEKRLTRIQEKIDQKQKQLEDLSEATRELQRFKFNLENAERYFQIVEASAKRIAEKCNTVSEDLDTGGRGEL